MKSLHGAQAQRLKVIEQLVKEALECSAGLVADGG